MRCLKCQYPLWDLKPGACPECGELFDPTVHLFKPGSVRFCCPHCDQAYFGDGEGGHLYPTSFDCVGCGRAIDESECIIRPREDGSHEDRTVPDLSPWHDSERTAWKRFWGTVGMSMVRPGALGRGLPRDAKLRGGFWFFVLVNTMALVFGLGPFFLAVFLAPLVFGGGGGGFGGAPPLFALVIPLGLLLLLWIPVLFIGLCIYGGIIHLVLKLSGSTTGGFGRTLTSIGFSTGPLMIGAVPFLGYCLQTPAQIWVIVTTIILLTQSQAVSGVRATFAVLTPVFLGIVLYVVFLGIMMFGTAARIPVAVPPAMAQAKAMAVSGSSIAVSISGMTWDPQYVTIDSGPFLEAIATADSLPTAQEIGDLPGVTSTIPKDGALPTETRYRGGGFEAWSLPGLFVIKVGDAAGYAFITSMTDLDASFEINVESHNPVMNSSSSAAAQESAFYAKVVEKIDALGGTGKDLDKNDFEQWMASCIPLYFVKGDNNK